LFTHYDKFMIIINKMFATSIKTLNDDLVYVKAVMNQNNIQLEIRFVGQIYDAYYVPYAAFEKLDYLFGELFDTFNDPDFRINNDGKFLLITNENNYMLIIKTKTRIYTYRCMKRDYPF